MESENVVLKIEFIVREHFSNPIVGFHVRDYLGQDLFGENTFLTCIDSPLSVHPDKSYLAEFRFKMPILPMGDYSICAAVAEGTQVEHVQHHWMNDALLFKSHSSSCSTGLVGVHMQHITIEAQEG